MWGSVYLKVIWLSLPWAKPWYFASREFDEVFVFEDLMTVLSAFDFQRIYSWMASVPNSPIIDWVRYSLVVTSVIMDIISKWTWIYHHTMKSSTQYPVEWMCLPCDHIICLLCFRKHKAALHVTYQCRFCGKFIPARGSIYGWLVST